MLSTTYIYKVWVQTSEQTYRFRTCFRQHTFIKFEYRLISRTSYCPRLISLLVVGGEKTSLGGEYALRQQDVTMHSTQQCVKDGTVTEKHNQTPHVTGRNRLERANGIGATETRVHLHRPVVPIWLPSTEICPMSPILPTPPKHYHREKQTHHSSNDTRITQFISENHSVGN